MKKSERVERRKASGKQRQTERKKAARRAHSKRPPSVVHAANTGTAIEFARQSHERRAAHRPRGPRRKNAQRPRPRIPSRTALLRHTLLGVARQAHGWLARADRHDALMLALPLILYAVLLAGTRYAGPLADVTAQVTKGSPHRALTGLPSRATPVALSAPEFEPTTELSPTLAAIEPAGLSMAGSAVQVRPDTVLASRAALPVVEPSTQPPDVLLGGADSVETLFSKRPSGVEIAHTGHSAPVIASIRTLPAASIAAVAGPTSTTRELHGSGGTTLALAGLPIPIGVTTLPEGYELGPDALAKCQANGDGYWGRSAALQTAPADPDGFGLALAAAARAQIGQFVIYNDKYQPISYPGGDVHPMYGVCTDVVIRAYRVFGIDLQSLVHKSRIGVGDRSIDHRRVETLRLFFSRFGESLPVTSFAEDYRPGDIVTYDRPQNRRSRAHIAIVSDVMARSGRPLVIHNRGWGPQQEDALFVDEITGHYRFHRMPDEVAKSRDQSRAPGNRVGLAPLAKSLVVPARAQSTLPSPIAEKRAVSGE